MRMQRGLARFGEQNGKQNSKQNVEKNFGCSVESSAVCILKLKKKEVYLLNY